MKTNILKNKCAQYRVPQLAQAKGIYPYYTPIESEQGTVVQKDIQPTSGSCPNRSAGHFWENLGEVGSTCWQCSHCGLTVYSKNQPNALICPKSDRYHDWRRL